MPKPTDVRPVAASLYLLPVRTRMPLKFGPETLTEVTCARVKLTVEDRRGHSAVGWGETPLSVQWAWPGTLPAADRLSAMVAFCRILAEVWTFAIDEFGHPMEVGHDVLDDLLPGLLRAFNREERAGAEPMPLLAAMICDSAFDLALHDAFGALLGISTYQSYNSAFLNRDLAAFFDPEEARRFKCRFPGDFLDPNPPTSLLAWHLVGGRDPIDPGDLRGDEPDDGHPVLLRDWVRRDGLTSLKIKLTGTDPEWDFDRIDRVGRIAAEEGVEALSADFNCTVTDPEYVNSILDRVKADRPETFARLLYVEQPFPYDLEANRIDVRAVSRRVPLFLDESAHDWRLVRLGKSLGWTGVALKTCKTQTGALLSQAWAKGHGMALMVQDLTNPMLAQIAHAGLAAHSGTIRGIETNAMQFYPDASTPEAAVHPGLYRRRDGRIDLSSLAGPGFGYRLDEIARTLPEPEIEVSR